MSLTEKQKEQRWKDLEVSKRFERLMDDINSLSQFGEIEIVKMEYPTITIKCIKENK